MRIDPSEQVLYEWGRWVWYYRCIALIVYITGLLLVGMYQPARDLLLRPSVGNILLFAIIALMVGAWALIIWVTWRDGQSRVARMILLPESKALVVRTLNFGSRRVPLADLHDFLYADLKWNPASEYRPPTLTVQVRGRLPLVIDLDGEILDMQTFKSVFGYRPPARRRRRRIRR
jgi:hypothetical protein